MYFLPSFLHLFPRLFSVSSEKYEIEYPNKAALIEATKDIGLEQNNGEEHDESFYSTLNESFSQTYSSDPEISDISDNYQGEGTAKFLDNINANVSTVFEKDDIKMIPVIKNNDFNVSVETQNTCSDNDWEILNETEKEEATFGNPRNDIYEIVSSGRSSLSAENDKEVVVIDSISFSDETKWICDGKENNLKEKLLLQNRLFVEGDCYALAILISIVYEFRLQKVDIYDQKLTLQQYQTLTSSGTIKFLNIQSTSITESDGSLITADKLFGNNRNLVDFHVDCSQDCISFTPNTVYKILLSLYGIQNLQYLHLFALPESFKFSTFTNFLKKNETIDIRLVFDRFSSFSDSYKETIQSFMKCAISNPPKKAPVIEFPGIDQSLYEKYQFLL